MSNEELLSILKNRFFKNMNRHKGLEWDQVQERLEENADKLRSLHEMERTGGEPDVVALDETRDEYVFYDCSAESPSGRRNICYDREGQEERERKGVYPEGNAVGMAAAMGIELWGNFDRKTSSWVRTPSDIRKLGGAVFADFRYGHVFLYHNSAHSFYSSRGFRGCLKV